MARKTKQEIDKEVMFNKIMPSLSKVAEVEDDEDEDEDDTPAVKKRKTAKTKTRTSAKSRDDDDDDDEDEEVKPKVRKSAKTVSRKTKKVVDDEDEDDEDDEDDEEEEEEVKPKARKSAKVASKKSKKAVKKSDDDDENADYSDYSVININEELLKDRFDDIFDKFHCCHCNGCRSTVMALTLNSLETKYIAVKTDDVKQVIANSDDSQIRAAIIQSVLKLMINPIH